jgi:DMSO/TMAO reductase YedYZ molybdopterin-dependent catalytic subunit
MRRRDCAGFLLACLLAFRVLSAASLAPAAEAPGLAVTGPDAAAKTLSTADIGALPAQTLDVTFESEHGTTTGHFAGPSLWAVLEGAGLIPSAPRTHVRMTVTITGSDGYTAVLALGEIDPEFEGKRVLLATQQDGKPLGGTGLRLVVPGDKRGGRSVRDVVRIAVAG